jgi:hypothetical protein
METVMNRFRLGKLYQAGILLETLGFSFDKIDSLEFLYNLST